MGNTITAKEADGKGYAAKLQGLIDPVNGLLTAAAKDGVGFELYLRTFPGGGAATYHKPSDPTEGESASAECVSIIEILDVNTINQQTGQYIREMQNSEITYVAINGDCISVKELAEHLFAVNEYLEGAKQIGNTLIASSGVDAEAAGILRVFLSAFEGMSKEITLLYPEVQS